MYLSWDGPKLTGRQVFDRYWELADELGRDRNPYRLAFLQVVAVSETDERAEREYARHLEAHYRSGLGAIPHTAMAVPGYAEPAAIEGMLRSPGPAGMLSRMKTATYAEIVDSQVAIVGSPATVADQIEAFVREFRIGNLLVMLQNGSMPRELTEKNISLFAAEVLPRLRPVWDAEGWENHWWPRAAAIEGAVLMAAGPDAVRDEMVEVWDGRLRLHVKVAGDGPPLLFFHPLAGLAWQPLLDRLARRHTVYAPEHPGTSPGDPQAIREVQTYWELLLIYTELAGKLGLGLSGRRHSATAFGGMVAADLAACFPRLFSRLVLLSPLGLWRDDAPIPLMEMVSGPPSGRAEVPVRAPRQRGGAGRAGAARRSGAAGQGDRAGHLERRLHHEVRLADRRPRPRPPAAPHRGADAHRLGARGRAGPGRVREGVRPPDRGQPSRGARRLRPRGPGRPARALVDRDQPVPGQLTRVPGPVGRCWCEGGGGWGWAKPSAGANVRGLCAPTPDRRG